MPEHRVPKLSHHKASGQAIVRLNGKDFYLGPWGSRVAKIEYDRRVAEWLATGRCITDGRQEPLTVAQVMAAYWEHAEGYYRNIDGSPAKELWSVREALRPLRRLYGHTVAAEFGPLALKAVRESMIEQELCRTTINHHIGRIKRMYKWAVENELVPPSLYHGLQAVAGLKAGRSGASEPQPVKPVSIEFAQAVFPFVSRQVKAMIQLQLLTGMRSGEIVVMRGSDIDTSGSLWVYKPSRHKTQHLGHDRMVFLGPKAKKIVSSFLKPDLLAYLFSPADADAEQREKRHLARKTPMSCGNVPGSNVQRRPLKKPRDHYGVDSYARAIKYACERAFPQPEHLQPMRLPNGKRETRSGWLARLTAEQKKEIKAWRKAHDWHPHQLRHTAATNLRRNFGLEPAQVILGHKTLTVTQVYAEKNVEAAMRVMSEVG